MQAQVSAIDGRSCVYQKQFGNAELLTAPYPFVIGIDDCHTWRHDPLHWHEAFEIGFVLRGAGVLVVEDFSFPFQAGQIHIINGTDRHMAYATHDAQFANIHFHPDLLRDTSFATLEEEAQRPFVLGCQRFTPVLPACHPHTQHVLRLLREIMAEHARAAPYWPLAVKGLLIQVVSLLLRYFLAEEGAGDSAQQRQALRMRLTPALQLIEANLATPPSLAMLAAAVALSPSRFSALFQTAMGTSPVAYRNTRRLVLAQWLLTTTSVPISHIAEQCGFNTVQQFNQLFQRMLACTPGDYRSRLKSVYPPADPAAITE